MNLITTTEAARRLGISPQRVRALVAAGRLPVQRINTRLHLIDPRHLRKVRHRPPGRPKQK